MNTKTSVLVIGVKAIIYLLLYDLHDFTFNLESVSISKVHWCRFENLSICLCSYKKNFSYISRTHISESKRCINVKCSTYYFHMKTKILADFEICISAPLTPNHLLLGRQSLYYSNTASTVDRKLTVLSSTTDKINCISNHFWDRWRHE